VTDSAQSVRHDARPHRRWRRATAWTAAGIFGAAVIGATTGVALTDAPVTSIDSLAASPQLRAADGTRLFIGLTRDDQRRLPIPLESMGPWIGPATIASEDSRFLDHHGVDPVAIARAVLQNGSAGRVVSGASTITMQLCRMLDPAPRTLSSKLREAARAIQLERVLSKDQILAEYLNLAPYGGNIRGIEVAAAHWFGRAPAELTLSEAALLAGLPQSPHRLRPDRHPERAIARRNYVLQRMEEEGLIDQVAASRARSEPLTLRADIGVRAPHYAAMALARRRGGGTVTLDLSCQRAIEGVAHRAMDSLPAGAALAVVVVDVERSRVAALIGNLDASHPLGGAVNAATSWRSPGSALKPFIYAAALDASLITPHTLLPDTPRTWPSWAPRNIDRLFASRLTAAEALVQSRNLPAITLLESLGVYRASNILSRCGIRLSTDAVVRAGLSLAVGGAEIRPIDLAEAWATIARGGLHRPLRIYEDESAAATRVLGADACASLDAILGTTARWPAGSLGAASLPWFAWKTGTSSARRDAWAAGHNGQYAVVVWCGYLAGAGHPDLVGARAAQPILHAIFVDALPHAPAPLHARYPANEAERIALPHSFAQRGCIESPADGAVYAAIGSEATIEVRWTGAQDALWRLDGRAISATSALSVPPGTHDLLVVTRDLKHSDHARFTVIPGL